MLRPDLYNQPRKVHIPLRGGDGPSGPLARLFLLALVVGLGLAGWRAWGPLITNRWLEDPAAGLAAGAKSGKDVFVLYTSGRSPECQQLNRDIFMDPEVKAYLKREYVRVRVDLTRPFGPSHELAAKAGVRVLPAMIVYSPNGREITRVVGAEEVAAWIRRQARR